MSDNVDICVYIALHAFINGIDNCVKRKTKRTRYRRAFRSLSSIMFTFEMKLREREKEEEEEEDLRKREKEEKMACHEMTKQTQWKMNQW